MLAHVKNKQYSEVMYVEIAAEEFGRQRSEQHKGQVTEYARFFLTIGSSNERVT